MIITIDGPSGSGKSTMAKKLAEDIGFLFFDTGAMYRSVCWYIMEKGISLEDQPAIRDELEQFYFEFKREEGESKFFVNGQDVSKEIRDNEVNKLVSIISAYSFVREKLVELQKEFAKNRDVVFEGRDMGTVVFPNADYKFFLIAKPKIRAERRYAQLSNLYPNKYFDLHEIERELIKRDEYDSTRECSPLKQADDAVLLDTSNYSIEGVLKEMKKQIKDLKI
jgi:cytidylate kinase